MKPVVLRKYCFRLLAACPLLLSFALPASMAPLTAAPHSAPARYEIAPYQYTEVKPIWMKIDLDGDGTISRDELREEDPALLGRFDQADLDHDGTLSLGELELLLLGV
jgi:Ca2+-binding EF-hand superfamily protein